MKRITTLAVATLFCLVACNKGPNAISYKDWRAKAVATQPEEFTKVTATYESKKTGEEDATGTIEYTYDATEEAWTTESNDAYADSIATYIVSAKLYATRMPEEEEKPEELPEGTEYDMNYYDNLTIQTKVSMTQKQGEMSMSSVIEGKIEFAQGNWLTFYYVSEQITASGLTPAMETAIGVKNGTSVTSRTIRLSYSK